MADVNGLNSLNSVNFKSGAVANNSKLVNDNKPSNDKKMKTATKLMIGASALAAAVIGGVLLHKGSVARKAAEEAGMKFERERMPRLFSGKAKEEELAAKLKEIDKLSPAEQRKAYENLEQVSTNILSLQYAQKFGGSLRRGMKEIPKDVEKEMAAGNWIKAGELYEAHVQELPNTFRAKNIGATVEESISNVFGAETKVKPHTYDLSKEGEDIISLRNAGGYYDVIANKNGVLYEGIGSTSLPRAVSNTDNFLKNAKHTHIGDKATIIHGVDNEGKYVTILEMPDKNYDTKIFLGLTSNGKKTTPAQQDLLSLVEHPEKFDVNLIDKLTFKTNPEVTGAENMDYNLALSVIQSMAKG